jgi:hypothetical protein
MSSSNLLCKVTSEDWEIPIRAHPRQSGGPYMHIKKALIVKLSNLKPLHHKNTIDLFKIGKVSKTNKMILCKMGNFSKKKLFTCFAKEQLHFIAKLPLTLQIDSKFFMI